MNNSHGKFESIGSLFLSLTLVAAGLSIGAWSYERMHQVLVNQKFLLAAKSSSIVPMVSEVVKLPEWPAVILAIISIVSKEWLYKVTKRVGILLNSQILIANAWHHRSDAFSSVLSMISITAAILFPGLLVADSAAGILIAGMICISGMEILFESIKHLSDTSDKDLADSIKQVSLSVDGVLGAKNIRTRSIGSSSLIDLTVLTDTKLSASAAQALSERVRWKLLDTYPHVVDALVRTHSSSTPCPLLSQDNKSTSDIEKDIRSVLVGHMSQLGIEDVRRIMIYYVNPAIVNVEIALKLTEGGSLGKIPSIEDAKKVGATVSELIRRHTQGVLQVDVSMDLTDRNVETETMINIASLNSPQSKPIVPTV